MLLRKVEMIKENIQADIHNINMQISGVLLFHAMRWHAFEVLTYAYLHTYTAHICT